MRQMPEDLIPIRDAAKVVDRGYSTLRAWVKAGHLQPWRREAQANATVYVSRSELLAWMVIAGKAMQPPRQGSGGALTGQDGSGTLQPPIDDCGPDMGLYGAADSGEAPEAEDDPWAAGADDTEQTEARAEAQQARVEAQQARAEAGQARIETGRARAEAQQARADAERLREEMARLQSGTERLQAELRTAQTERGAAQQTETAHRMVAETLQRLIDAQQGHLRDLSAALEAERATAAAMRMEIEALRQAQQLPWWRRLLPLP